jgi:hypothetical protein
VGTNRIDGIYTDQRHVGRTPIWQVRARWTVETSAQHQPIVILLFFHHG